VLTAVAITYSGASAATGASGATAESGSLEHATSAKLTTANERLLDIIIT
jgi:hypothetical protein